MTNDDRDNCINTLEVNTMYDKIHISSQWRSLSLSTYIYAGILKWFLQYTNWSHYLINK